MIGIYKITNPKGKVYIGQSVELEKRLNYYKYFNCKNQTKLYNSFKKYGVENHIFEIITLCYEEQLNIFERDFQESYDVLGVNGLNCKLTTTDDKSGKQSEETKLKIKKGLLNSDRIYRPFTLEEKEKQLKGIKEFYLNNKSKLLGIKISENHKYNIKINSARSKKVICTKTGKIWNSAKDCYNELKFNIKYRTFLNYLSGKITNKTTIQWYN